MKSLLNNPYVFFYGILIVTFLIIRIPKVGAYFRVLNTLIHEVSHALMALLTNGEVYKIKLKPDTSGETVTAHSTFISKFLVALAGYPITALTATGVYWYISGGNYRLLFILFCVVSIISLLLWVRNGFGIVWLLLFIAGNVALLYFQNPLANKIVAYSFAAIIFLENIFSSFTLFVIAWKKPQSAGDASNLTKLTKIPSIIWALIFVAFNLFMAYWTVKWFFPW